MASASSALTAQQGLPTAWAKPLTMHTPMRTPVKEPGPVTAAKASMSSQRRPVARRAASTAGRMVCEWVRPTRSAAV